MRASDVKHISTLPVPILDGTERWSPFHLQADAAPAQKHAWRVVWPDERLGDYTRSLATAIEGALQLSSVPSFLSTPQLLQPGVKSGRIEGSCSWHVMHNIDQNKGRLFEKDLTRASAWRRSSRTSTPTVSGAPFAP